MVQQVIVEARGRGEAGHGLGHLGVLALAEPDGRGVGVGLCQGGVDHMLPASEVNEMTGELINIHRHYL